MGRFSGIASWLPFDGVIGLYRHGCCKNYNDAAAQFKGLYDLIGFCVVMRHPGPELKLFPDLSDRRSIGIRPVHESRPNPHRPLTLNSSLQKWE